MPARKSGDQAEPTATGTVTISGRPVVATATTIIVDGANPDVDLTVTVTSASGGTDAQTVHADENGHAEAVVVPNASGPMTVTVTELKPKEVGTAEADVSGQPYVDVPEEAVMVRGAAPTVTVPLA